MKTHTHSILVALVAILAAAVTTTALAASAAKNPKTMALKQTDFPGGARLAYNPGPVACEAGSCGWAATFRYRTGGKPNELSNSVVVAKSLPLARAFYRELKSDGDIPIAQRLALPKYGDEQVAYFSFAGGSNLLVRKNSVVWMIELQTFLTRDGKTHELTMAEAIAEYKRYAAIVQRRVGSG